MELEKTPLKDCFIITPRVFKDDRGIFIETFKLETFEQLSGKKVDFVQDNQSHSTKGVLRGLHFQKGSFAQAKLVRAVQGRVLDVVVDMRKDSPSFGKYFSIVLDDVKHQQLFVPRGFAHGFITLSETSIFGYKCDNYYNQASEGGILYNDATLGINWHLKEEELLISKKDMQLPTFQEIIAQDTFS